MHSTLYKVGFSDIGQLFSNLFVPRRLGRDWLYVFGSSVNVFRDIDYLRAFLDIPEVNAVIGTKATFTSNGHLKVVNDKLEEQVNDPINKLLKNPNWFQAQKEFMMQSTLFHEIYGNEYIYSLTPIGLTQSIKALFTLPPNLVTPKYLDQQPFFLFDKTPDNVKYVYKDGSGREVPIDGSSIIHLNDNRVAIRSVNDNLLLKGESKLRSLAPVINNMRLAYESRGVILKNRGADGALTNDSFDKIGAVPLTEEETEDLQKKFASNYGTLNGQSQIIISNKALKWVQMGVKNPEQLGLFQETEDGMYKLVDAFGMKIDLFARTKGATFENQKQAEKECYLSTIIPEANERAYALNQKYFPDGKNKIICDYTHLLIFQEDLKAKADVLNTMIQALSKAYQDQIITIDEYKAELIKYGIGQPKQ